MSNTTVAEGIRQRMDTMDAKQGRKRKSNSSHSASTAEGGPRRSQRFKTAGNEQMPPSSSSSATASTSSSSPGCLSLLRCRSFRVNPKLRRFLDPRDACAPPTETKQEELDTFFRFPAEIRNMIYEYSLQYPESRQLYSSYYRNSLPLGLGQSLTWAPLIRAPTILLLNKRITSECLPMLKSRTLVIDRLPPPRPIRDKNRKLRIFLDRDQNKPGLFMKLSDFVPPRTLQCISYIDINVGLCEGPLGSGWAWLPIVEELLEILKHKNVCTKLRLLIRRCNTREDPTVWHGDEPYQALLQKKLKEFADDNPHVFARREIRVDVWKIEGLEATFVSSDTYPEPTVEAADGWVIVRDSSVLIDEDESCEKKEYRSEEPRRYPDKEMFPGSVLQFAQHISSPY